MDKKTLAALQASISAWASHAKAVIPQTVTLGVDNCALCKLFRVYECNGCPVAACTGNYGCKDTPYPEANSALRDARQGASMEAFRLRAEEEVAFLKSLLPAKAAQTTE